MAHATTGPYLFCAKQERNRNYWALYATIGNFRDKKLSNEQLVRPLQSWQSSACAEKPFGLAELFPERIQLCPNLEHRHRDRGWGASCTSTTDCHMPSLLTGETSFSQKLSAKAKVDWLTSDVIREGNLPPPGEWHEVSSLDGRSREPARCSRTIGNPAGTASTFSFCAWSTTTGSAPLAQTRWLLTSLSYDFDRSSRHRVFAIICSRRHKFGLFFTIRQLTKCIVSLDSSKHEDDLPSCSDVHYCKNND